VADEERAAGERRGGVILAAEFGILESSSSSGFRLRLIFEQGTDRVAHLIELLNPAGEILAELRSAEGTSADEWPPSPVLQSCSLQEIRPAQSAAFLVGMAGKSHWSASIEVIPDECAFALDVACRVQEQPRWVGSSYHWRLHSHASVVHFKKSQAGILMRVGRSDQGAGAQEKMPPGDEVLRIVGSNECPQKFPATLRWKYQVALETIPQ